MFLAAGIADAIAEKVAHAFDPLIALLQGVAYPITVLSISTGVLLVIIGQKNAGMKMIKMAAIGYLIMQWLPGLLSILREVGKAMQ